MKTIFRVLATKTRNSLGWLQNYEIGIFKIMKDKYSQT